MQEYLTYYTIDLGDIQDGEYYEIGEEVNHLLQPKNILHGDIDFDDMPWLPVKMDMPCESFDYIFVDELQDTNKVQIELALKHANGHSRIIGVGDRYQSIYGWRGADVDAIPNLISRLNAQSLPLSITYRNPLKVVDLVKSKYPHINIEPREDAQDGVVETLKYTSFLDKVSPPDMVLCRVNAPLVSPAMHLISRGVKAIIKGRDIGKNLQALVKKVVRKTNPRDFYEFIIDMEDHCRQEMHKFSLLGRSAMVALIEDQMETILALTEYCKTVDDLLYRIETIFSDETLGVTFSSVHRAKGLESENVFILHPELIPHPRAKLEWQKKQEENLEYVAYTRSLNGLYFVAS